MANKIDKNKSIANNDLLIEDLQEIGDQQQLQEIIDLINNADFIDFAHTISDFIDDGMTFDEILSSQVILKQALAILKQAGYHCSDKLKK